MLGYKAFNKDLTCLEFQYKIGGTYKFDGEPIPCEQGFHFCKSIPDVYNYYLKDDSTRVCKVEATGDIKSAIDDILYCTNEIKILEEITEESVRKANVSSTSTGFCNSGDYNSGHWNSGDNNTGNHNSGNHNSGDRNNGNWNTGNCNSGHWNIGNRNSGNWNIGIFNSGYWNVGDMNSGYWNRGDYNSGNWNNGNYNSGDWNKTDYSSGCFNTEKETIRMFNKPTNITLNDWQKMEARYILSEIPKKVVDWIDYKDMTDEEKEKYPTSKTTGGYLKVLDEKESAQLYWDGLSDDDKQKIYDLPNFDKDIFKECTGIDVDK
jgi:hypothetical protein